ncbi:Putative peptidoglycan binding domain/L,D-transpeptidase catalytic domain [Pannonibacter indicus]|uniref:Putative peptidoglycan binding domain/L,D-transpeptidase catalytic domain n=2 Tax=Pannonibacter indicus TaxID=466044 RepID=A0A0K6HVX5_9HYPH|nr:Putative peptidoglycan binding domain/L,D-transpeptidase catalytic domain [Pannonibacter indicus]
MVMDTATGFNRGVERGSVWRVALMTGCALAMMQFAVSQARAEGPAGLKQIAGLAKPAEASMTASAAETLQGAVEISDPEHPMQIVVSLREQNLKVYRGLELVTSTPVSSGKTGYSTPTGVFSILEKRRKHFSNLYDNAPMPYMQRLTWSGIALHEGKLPGYPASHGCVRMPMRFAQDLFTMTRHGMHVVITNGETAPVAITHAVLPQPYAPGTTVASLDESILPASGGLRGSIITDTASTASIAPQTETQAAADFGTPLRMIIQPRPSGREIHDLQAMLNRLGFEAGPVDGVMGRKTRDAIRLFQQGYELPVTGNYSLSLLKRVYREAGEDLPLNAELRIRAKFKDIYQAGVTLKDPKAPIGTVIFTALGFKPGDSETGWMAVVAEEAEGMTPARILDRIDMPATVRKEVGAMLTPGSSLIVTDRPFLRNTGLGTDFVVTTTN